jgi:hypothetical protein
MIKAFPLGAPTNSSPVSIEDGAQRRLRMEGIKLALFEGCGDADDLGLIAGTPPAWFAHIWEKSKHITFGDLTKN